MDAIENHLSLTRFQAFRKRLFDVCLATVGLLLSWWLIGIAFIAASVDTRSNGFFAQQRVGRNGRLFTVIKIKTMRPDKEFKTSVTTTSDPRITGLGRFFRKTKIDELPQPWNVLIGDMSFVGPRPDVPGYADQLVGEARMLLNIRPGITGPATLKYRNEEDMLAAQADPEGYNREVIYPDKVRINLEYIRKWNMMDDLKYIWRTFAG